jgi:radical SAM protein with 4Fe4S-binding SPASM domain
MSLSVSVEPLIRILGPEEFKDNPLLKFLTGINADTHMVLYDYDKDTWFEPLFKHQLDIGIKRVRVSTAKCSTKLNDRVDDVIKLWQRLADYIYFTGDPKFGRSSFDYYLMSNIMNKLVGREIKDIPPTLCGAGYSYVAVDPQGDIYPCDMFASMKALKMGSIYSGFDTTTSIFFQKEEWKNEIFEDCQNCKIVDDFRLCPRAMCLAENYQKHGSPFKPSQDYCRLSAVDVATNEYIVKRAMELGCIQQFSKLAQAWHRKNMIKESGKEKYGIEERFGLKGE